VQQLLLYKTSIGILSLVKAKKTAQVILAVGCMPAATLLLNSFNFKEKERLPGSTFGAHTISSVVARIHKDAFKFTKECRPDNLVLGAYYLAGIGQEKEDKFVGSFHVQISLIYDPSPAKNGGTAHKYMPDVVASASPEQLETSEDYVVFVLAILGETEIAGKNSLKKNSQTSDPTCNVTLKWEITERDAAVWKAMDEISLQLLQGLRKDHEGKEHTLQYWHSFEKPTDLLKTGEWVDRVVPPFHVAGMVHESSVVRMGSRNTDVVGLDFRPYGVQNVYVTGSGLWPSAASWNPTMTMCAFAQRLADNFTGRK